MNKECSCQTKLLTKFNYFKKKLSVQELNIHNSNAFEEHEVYKNRLENSIFLSVMKDKKFTALKC